ncbi:hypothetical protein BLNAU_17756 [Blattamonas nauphoetae]|uniref:Uncharacterized protein n=1 Tax=Blattamonas nauphoetae TaxID=2049346 RepID=A0ABQ9X6F1_9EUKA|nr:hypothetical protein BLNAU_17756 [Blattamonas nauphoetae]
MLPGSFVLQNRTYNKPKKPVVLKNKPNFVCSIAFGIVGLILIVQHDGGNYSHCIRRVIGVAFQLFACRFAIVYKFELDFENDKFVFEAGGNCCATMCSNVRRRDELTLEELYAFQFVGWKTMTTPKVRDDAFDSNGIYKPAQGLGDKPTYVIRVVTRMGTGIGPNYYFPLNQIQELFDAWNEYQGWAIQNGKRDPNAPAPGGHQMQGMPQQAYGQPQQGQQGYPQQVYSSQGYPQQQYPQQYPQQQQYGQQAYVQPVGQPGQYQPEYNTQNGMYQPPAALPGEQTHSFPAETSNDPGIADEKKIV